MTFFKESQCQLNVEHEESYQPVDYVQFEFALYLFL